MMHNSRIRYVKALLLNNIETTDLQRQQGRRGLLRIHAAALRRKQWLQLLLRQLAYRPKREQP